MQWIIDWSKVTTIEHIKELLQCCDLQPRPSHPMFFEIEHLCKEIDEDGKPVGLRPEAVEPLERIIAEPSKCKQIPEIKELPMEQNAALISLLGKYKHKAKTNVDKALCALLTRFKDELPPLDYRFHKSFRQDDCVDVKHGGHIDMALWFLLDESELFWEMFEKYGEKEE